MQRAAKLFFSRLRESKRKFLLVGFTERTGYSLAQLFEEQGLPYCIFDRSPNERVLEKLKTLAPQQVLFGAQNAANFLSFKGVTDVLVSPGVPRGREANPFLAAARSQAVPLWSDFDFLYPLYKNKLIVGLTGTDGKSTVVTLLARLLETVSSVYLCGNIGIPIASQLSRLLKSEVVVLELSSYMLEELKQFRANLSTVLNLSKAHEARYQNFEAYAAAKYNLVRYAKSSDFFLQNLDDPITKQHPLPRAVKRLDMRLSTTTSAGEEKLTTRSKPVSGNWQGSYLWQEQGEKGRLQASLKAQTTLSVSFPLEKLPQLAAVPRSNLLAALSLFHQALLLLQQRKKSAWKKRDFKGLAVRGLKNFRSLPHRLERVPLCAKRTYRLKQEVYNDSKATTTQAVAAALTLLAKRATPLKNKSEEKSLTLVLGGSEPHFCLHPLTQLPAWKQVQRIFVYGRMSEGFIERGETTLPEKELHLEKEFLKVVTKAFTTLGERAILLLSPGSDSFDQFSNFEERGNAFKALILSLEKAE